MRRACGSTRSSRYTKDRAGDSPQAAGLGDGRGAVSLQVRCETQVEVDYFWGKLTNGGQEGPCGWLKDKYGLSWQVVPAAIPKMMTDADPAKSECHERFLENEKARHRSDRRAYAGQPQ
jgi:hypothetical protein